MRFALSTCALILAGCVTQGTHDKLKAEHERTRADLARTGDELRRSERQVAELTEVKRALQADVDRLAADVARVEGELAAAVEARRKLESELTAAAGSRAKLEGSVEAMRSTLADLARRKEEAEARVAEFKSLLDRFKSLIDAGKLRVKIVDGKMVVSLPSDVLFASGSSGLSKEGKAAIAEVAMLLSSIPARKFQIEGHTDNVPTGPGRSNWQLASARALTVLNTMLGAGMPPERISAAAYGDAQPAQPNDTPEGRTANRRIEIVVVPDLSALPGFEELQRVGEEPTAVAPPAVE